MKKRFVGVLAILVVVMFCITACNSGSAANTASSSNTAADSASAISSTGTEKPAEAVTFVAAHAGTEESPFGHFFLGIQKYLEENSDDLTMELYPAGQLGSDVELAESVQEGSIQMAAGATAAYVSIAPDLCIFDLPFAYDGYKEMRDVCSDDDFAGVLDEILAQNGLKLGCIRAEGFRTLFSKVPVKTYEDIKGLDLRVMDNKYHMALWSELGANVTTVAFTELYTALQQGVVEAQENTITSTLTAYNLYETTNYATVTKHEPTIQAFLINLEWFESLSESQQQELMDACAYARDNEEDLDVKDQESAQTLIDKYGYEFYKFTDDDLKACRELTKEAAKMVEDNVNPDLYEALTNTIIKYR